MNNLNEFFHCNGCGFESNAEKYDSLSQCPHCGSDDVWHNRETPTYVNREEQERNLKRMLARLSPEEYEKVEVPTPEEIREALKNGRRNYLKGRKKPKGRY